MKLTRLFKKTSTGAIQYWEISVQGNKIITRYGQEGGKEQTTEDTIKEGKNLGRSNETSEVEQAQAEAQSQWEAKIKKGYVENLARAEKGETDHSGGFFPMLAHKFSEQGHKIVYPAYVQPKLDGIRAVSDLKSNLWTRTRKPYVSVPHIVKALKTVNPNQYDGELYNHEYRDNFEQITHLVNQKKEPAEGHEVVEYHIFDVNQPGPFSARYEWLKANLPSKKPLVLVETLEVRNEEELMEAFDHYLALGYEGAIVRNAMGLYVGKRSYDLQKIKEFLDDEFKVVGIEEGRGKLQGHVGAFICQTEDGTEFKAKMVGELSRLKDYYENPKLWKGKWLTVKYQGLTTKNNVPRFPRGLRFRED